MELAARVEDIVGRRVVAIDEVPGAGGYTPALRRVATLDDGTTVFVKVAVNELTSQWLRMERGAYRLLHDVPFAPRCIGSADDVLVLEDLRRAHWPPPWRDGDLELVLATLEDIASRPAPEGAPCLEAGGGTMLRRWTSVAEDPAPFLGLGLCSATWFERALPLLLEAESASLVGDSLVHFDVRSDNMCVIDGRVVLVDWTGTCRGRADFDRTCFAQTLTYEGGPEPHEVLPDADVAMVSMIAGYMAHNAPQPIIPDAPHVRTAQLAQLRVSLPWAARLLDLPPPA